MKASTKDILREIKKSKLRFFYICSIIALGVAFFTGIKATSPSMITTALDYFSSSKLSDFKLISTYGIRDEDISRLEQVDGVIDVQGGYSMDVVMQIEDSKEVIKILSLPDEGGLNEPRLLAGRYPLTTTECVIENPGRNIGENIKIGDTISVLDESRTPEELANLKSRDYEIVGFIESPLYVSIERGNTNIGDGSIDGYIMVTPETFNYERFTEAYIYTDVSSEGMDPYSDEYTKAQEQMITSLEKVGDQILDDNIYDIKIEALKELGESQHEYDLNKEEFDEKIAEAQEELDEGKKELDEGYEQYYSGVNQLNSEMAVAEQTLADSQRQLDEGYAAYYAGVDLLQRQTLEAKNQLILGQNQLEEGRLSYNQGLADFNLKMQLAEEQLRQAERELEKGYQSYNEGLAEFNAQISEAEKQLNESQAEFDKSYNQFKEQEDAFYNQIDSAQAQLDIGWNSYYKSLDEYNLKKEEYENQKNKLEDSIAFLEKQIPIDQQTYQEENAAYLKEYEEFQAALEEWGDKPLSEELKEQQEELRQKNQELESLNKKIEDNKVALEKAKAGLVELEISSEALNAMKIELDKSYQELSTKQYLLDQQRKAGEAELDKVRKPLLAAKAELEAAWDEFNVQKETGQAQLDTLYQTLVTAQDSLESGKKELEENRISGVNQLTEALNQLLAAEKELERGKNELELQAFQGEQQLQAAYAELVSGALQIQSGRIQLETQRRKAEQELNEALVQLQEAQQKILDGQNELDSQKEEGEKQLADALTQLQDARAKINDLDRGTWYVYTRDDNPGYTGYQEDSERIDKIGNVFPLFFFLVAALVAFTTMTRMVEEERTQIGTLSALGFSRWQILKKFVIYAGTAAIIGATVGWILGVYTLPLLIFTAYNILYQMPDLILNIPWTIVIISYIVALICTVGAAVIIALAELRNVPAELMRPKAPKPGKRIFIEKIPMIWNKLNFISKVSARNIFRYKARFLMTVFGIAGCTALILAGFGLHDAIFTIIPNQFGTIFKYDESLILTESSEDLTEQVEKVLSDERVSAALAADQQSITVSTDNGTLSAYLVVPEDPEQLSTFIGLHERNKPDEEIKLDNNGVVVSEKLATNYDAEPGKTINLTIDKKTVEVKVSAQTENYLQNYIYMSPELYESVVGSKPLYSTILVNFNEDVSEDEQSDFATQMINTGEFTSAVNTSSVINTSSKTLESLNIIVIVMIVSAGLLAFIVLNNLTNINISERIREIATLKVLGFRQKETNNYIFRENIILAIFGIIIGIGLGILLLRYIIYTVELDIIMFGRKINFVSYIYSIVLTIGFTIIVNFTMIPVMNKVNMVESLKDID